MSWIGLEAAVKSGDVEGGGLSGDQVVFRRGEGDMPAAGDLQVILPPVL